MSQLIESFWIVFAEGRIYFIFYAVLAGAMLVELLYENAALSRWLARAGALAIVLLVGLRWETGTDWEPYYRIFYTNDTSADYDMATFGIDYGYLAFNQLVYLFTQDMTVFLILSALLAVGLVYIFIEKSTLFPCMGVYLLYTSYIITHFMGSNRRMIAIGFVCVAFGYLRKERSLLEKWPAWTLPLAGAWAMHRTSLAAAPLMFISKRQWPTIVVLAALVASLALGLLGVPFAILQWMGAVLSDYTGIAAINKLVFYTSDEATLSANLDVNRQALFGVLKRSTVLAIFIAYMHYQRPSTYATQLYNIFLVGCILYFAMVGSPIFQIISTYFSIVEIVLLPIIFQSLKQMKAPFVIYLLAVPLLLLLSSLIPYMELYVPYRSIYGYH
jgi:hypothetical protein